MLILLGLTLVGCFVLLDLKDRRHARQVAELCQRIQAPDVAVAQHVGATVAGPEGLGYVPVDDDDAWQQNLEEQLNGD